MTEDETPCNTMDLEKAMAPHSSTLAWKIPWFLFCFSLFFLALYLNVPIFQAYPRQRICLDYKAFHQVLGCKPKHRSMVGKKSVREK